MPEPGPLLGVDHGLKFIGLAVCDASWIVARPLMVLERASREADFARIKDIIAQHGVTGVVVGIPLTPEAFGGLSQAKTVRRWMSRLAAALDVPVYGWDEGLSTFEAETLTAEAGGRPAGRIDDRAAAVILQSFIDAIRAGTPLPRPVKVR